LQRNVDKFSEFTVETNPESLDEEKAALFLDSGVNRISIGIQSFNDANLKRLGRIHDSLFAKKAVLFTHKEGFENISIDLIFGIRQGKFEDWKKDLEEAVSLPIKHISCYSLDCKRLEAEEEETVDMYEYAVDFLSDNGFRQYEVSNFALDGYMCLHNLNYWNNDPYIGLGPSAVSYINGRRAENTNDVVDYIRRAGSGETVITSSENLKEIDSAKETAAVKIRTMEGIDFEWFRKKTGFDFLDIEKDALPKLLEEGLVEYLKDKHAFSGVALSREGVLFCDIVSSAFL
jgi:oxygen-independent coproporphyrinogen-3 oxidase